MSFKMDAPTIPPYSKNSAEIFERILKLFLLAKLNQQTKMQQLIQWLPTKGPGILGID